MLKNESFKALMKDNSAEQLNNWAARDRGQDLYVKLAEISKGRKKVESNKNEAPAKQEELNKETNLNQQPKQMIH